LPEIANDLMCSLFRFLVFRLLRTHRRHYRFITASAKSLEILDISSNMPSPLLKRGDMRLAEVDRGIRNPFRWNWLDVKVNIDVHMIAFGCFGGLRLRSVPSSDILRRLEIPPKCAEPGVAFCRM
jgi:hypothetical protein